MRLVDRAKTSSCLLAVLIIVNLAFVSLVEAQADTGPNLSDLLAKAATIAQRGTALAQIGTYAEGAEPANGVFTLLSPDVMLGPAHLLEIPDKSKEEIQEIIRFNSKFDDSFAQVIFSSNPENPTANDPGIKIVIADVIFKPSYKQLGDNNNQENGNEDLVIIRLKKPAPKGYIPISQFVTPPTSKEELENKFDKDPHEVVVIGYEPASADKRDTLGPLVATTGRGSYKKNLYSIHYPTGKVTKPGDSGKLCITYQGVIGFNTGVVQTMSGLASAVNLMSKANLDFIRTSYPKLGSAYKNPLAKEPTKTVSAE